jgi:HD-GYP domain-containing protein (c-di-GMP phosphodiesterase class II)
MKIYLSATDHIDKLTKIGIAISAEKNIDEFFELVLEEAIHYSNADAGSLYTVSDDKKFLDFQFVCTLSKNIRLGRADISRWPSVPLYEKNGNKNLKNFVSYVFHTKESTHIDDVYNQDIFDNSGTKKYDSANNYHSKSMVAIPLKNHENEVLGVIQLINSIDHHFEIVPFNKEHITMLTSLASQAAIALTNKKLIKGLENLLYQFIKVIASAIDKKSKFTGGHIARVANLTELITHKIQKDNKYFKNVRFSDVDIQEISMAGWMHDFGKITTPVYIMDKATKLETIFDRIELIKTRYELLKLILENEKISNKDNSSKKSIEKTLSQLEEDWVFLQKTNKEPEFLKKEDIDRIERIFQFNYEYRGKKYFLISENEKNNLSIQKGTLLNEEMEKMRDHVMVTHDMLSQLSFPVKFKNVPLYASSHHEKLNGKGYPFKLTEEKMPLQSRIIAVADIFESLTASDRPYKKGKTLSETLKILAHTARDNEIDKDILTLLLDSGLFLKYAKKNLKPEQIDDVEIEKIKAIYE